jgi:hypothetical protein
MIKKMIIIYFAASFILVAKELPSKQHFEKFCFDCHADGVDKGGIDFDVLLKKDDDEKWAKIWEVIEKEQMPPSKKKQPTHSQRNEMLLALEKSIFKVDRHADYAKPITLYRLSNTQFSNSLKNTFSYYSNVNQQLPPEATTLGFNNIAGIMNVSPLHFESYKNIAFNVSRDMFKDKSKNGSAKKSGTRWLKLLGDASEKSLNKLLKKLLLKTFRRPPTSKELNSFTNLFKQVKQKTGSNKDALMETVRASIISPAHIFRTELMRTDGAKGELLKLDEYALASRMSFFLWDSPPDDNLLKMAEKKELRKNLPKVIGDMIKQGRFENFAFSFGQQWLHITNVPYKANSNKERPYYYSMKKETLYWVKYLFQENRPLSEFFTSKVSFIDKKLAEWYKLPEPKKNGFHKHIFSKASHRIGVLTQPSILTATSDPDRTSPVKRGLFLLESVLGMPPPPAPANIPAIEEAKKKNKERKLNFAELLAIHRADKKCASCHDMMDPLGLALENFDKIGRWRDKENGIKISFSAKWRGHTISNFNDLQKVISKNYHSKFLKCLTEKLMIYSLSRGLAIKDHVALMKIVKNVSKPDATFQDILLQVISSTPFQYRLKGTDDDS